jgi:DNA-binding FadR family transcriptional regulator
VAAIMTLKGSQQTSGGTDSRSASGRQPGTASRLRVQRLRPAYRQVADELRAQIVAGVLSAGERLPTEPELGQMFGVSRGTVREALRVLASQHLIETTRGVQGGSFVASPEPARLIEDLGGALGVLVMTPRLSVANLLEARLMLEPGAARLAAERADQDTVEAVRVAANAPRDARDPSGFAPHIDFHTTVLMATGNPMLAMMLQPISDVLRTRLERTRAHDRTMWDEIDACHVVLGEAIAAGDGERAEQLMRAHLLELLPLYEEIDTLQPPAADSPA